MNDLTNHRIFLALGVSTEVQAEAIAWQENYLDLPVRWLSGKNLHITLVPPWHVDDISEVIEKLNKGEWKTNQFEGSFDLVTYGPDQREPRLIWATGDAPKEALSLKEKLERGLGFEPEKRRFNFHLTLARFRPEDFGRFKEKKMNDKISWRSSFDSVTLFESHLSRNGADYEIISEFPLK